MSLASEQSLESAYVMGTFARKPVELVRGLSLIHIYHSRSP